MLYLFQIVTSTGDIAIFTRGNLSIENSKVDANAPQDKKGIKARKTTTINQSWITTTGDESYDSINDSVLFNGNDGKVIGNVTVIGEETVSSEKTLIIPEGTTLTIPDKAKFTNNGTVVVNGTIINNGQITCTNHSGGKATCIQKAVCELCNQEYGDLLEHNYSTKWMNNEEIHWQECTVCHNHKDESKHIFDDDKDTVCNVCGYERMVNIKTPKIIKGQNSKWKKDSKIDFVFVSDADYSDFVSVSIDGKIIDSKNYVSKEGSTIITLKSDYLNTLSVGKHTISINSTTGSASTEFIIESNEVETPVKDDNKKNDSTSNNQETVKPVVKAENKQEVKKVKTGDDENIIGIALLLLGSLVVLTYIRKKKID